MAAVVENLRGVGGRIFGEVVGNGLGLIVGEGEDVGEATSRIVVLFWVGGVRLTHGLFAITYCCIQASLKLCAADLTLVSVWSNYYGAEKVTSCNPWAVCRERRPTKN